MKKTLNKISYRVLENGILIPESLVKDQQIKVTSPESLLPLLVEESYATQEHFVIFTLDASHQIIKKHVVTVGLVNASQVHPRETFRNAILDNACGIIAAHNHPSGSLEASTDDLLTTRRLADAGKILGIPLVDHLIVSQRGLTSVKSKFPAYF